MTPKAALDHIFHDTHPPSREICKLLDVSHQTVRDWINEKYHPSEQRLRRMAMGTAVQQIFAALVMMDDPPGGAGV